MFMVYGMNGKYMDKGERPERIKVKGLYKGLEWLIASFVL